MSNGLKQLQKAFSQVARGHKQTQSFHFDERRSSIYQRLLLNNLNEVVSPCFPVLLSILPAHIWQRILKDFLKHYPVTTPIFHELPWFIVEYLKKRPVANYPFAHELAHYEWVELEVELCEPNSSSPDTVAINILEQIWQLSTTAQLLEYNYEVDKISPDYQPKKEIKTYLIVYQLNDKVAFLKLNELSFQLLSMMLHESMSAKKIFQLLCEMHSQFNKTDLVSACSPLINQLYEERILKPVR